MSVGQRVEAGPPADSIEGYPLSVQQEKAWDARGIVDLRVQGLFVICGAGNPDQIIACARSLAALHEIWRTTYMTLPGMRLPLQVVGKKICIDFEADVLQGSDTAARLERQMHGDWRAPFDLARGVVGLFRVLALSPTRAYVLVTMSALAADTRALRNWVEGVVQALGQGAEAAAVQPPQVQYAQFAQWERERIESADLTVARKCWADRGIALSTPAPKGGSAIGPNPLFEELTLQLVCSADSPLVRLATVSGCTLESALLAAWTLALWRVSGDPRQSIYRRCDGRYLPELESSCGAFARYLPLALVAGQHLTLAEFLRGIQAKLQELQSSQDVPFWGSAIEA
jgi:hypothetical protein